MASNKLVLLFLICLPSISFQNDVFEFENSVYTGQYISGNVSFIDPIVLVGYNDDVTYYKEGEHSEYFSMTTDEDKVHIFLESTIPGIFDLRYIIFTLYARKSNGERTHTIIHIPIEVPTGNFADGNCELEGLLDEDWIEYQINTIDSSSGTTFSRKATNIEGINSIEIRECETKDPPYVDVTLQSNLVVFTLNEKFKWYEYNETSTEFTMVIDFLCDSGNRKLKVIHKIRDTNNHAPEFLPWDLYEFTVFLPLPRNYLVAEITVRDVDLSTFAVDAQIGGNQYFEVLFQEQKCDKKHYKIKLFTIKNVASLPPETRLSIIINDRDRTGFPSIFSFGTIVIRAFNVSSDSLSVPQFEIPMYKGYIYATDNRVEFFRPIKLSHDMGENVKYSLQGDGAENFEVVTNESGVNIKMIDEFTESILVFTISATVDDEFYGRATIQLIPVTTENINHTLFI